MDCSRDRRSYLRVLLGDIEFDDLHDGFYEKFVDDDDKLSLYSRKDRCEYNLPPEEYLPLFINNCTKRRLFVTRKWFLGIGPEKAQRGDYVCVLEESVVPAILGLYREDRWSPTGLPLSMKFDKTHYFAGEAVLGGSMYAAKQCLQEYEDAGRIQVHEITLM
jgi:hypothetical protein